jgi:hypothetical protein
MEDWVNPAGLSHGAIQQATEPASHEITRNQRGNGPCDTDAVLQEIVGYEFKFGRDGERSFLSC